MRCQECLGSGVAEIIDHWERPCEACYGEGYIDTGILFRLILPIATLIAFGGVMAIALYL